MTSLTIQKFYPKDTILKKLIKFFWVFQCNDDTFLNHKILPTGNIDILFNFLSPISFQRGGTGALTESPGKFFFSGITTDHFLLKQKGRILTIGISFFPAGLYPFFKIPISEFKNQILGLDNILTNSAIEIEEKLDETKSIAGKIAVLEAFFLKLVTPNALPSDDTFRLLNLFYYNQFDIKSFCGKHNVHPRKLERIFNKYAGMNPKLFARLTRFQNVLNTMLNMNYENLTEAAHENDFYDQTHFIKDFKSFTGSPPSVFLKEKKSIKQIIKNS